jgi:hypothetical protein
MRTSSDEDGADPLWPDQEAGQRVGLVLLARALSQAGQAGIHEPLRRPLLRLLQQLEAHESRHGRA